MTVEAKICGLSTAETVEAAVHHGARFVGFVTFPKSPRHISTETMRALGALVPKTVTRVGLFVDPDDALLDEKLAGPRAGNEVVLAKREEIAAKKGE